MSFESYFNNEKYSDVIIKVQDSQFFCHKIVLAKLEFFDTMLSGNFKEATDNIIVIDDITPKCVEFIISALYKFDIYVNIEILSDEHLGTVFGSPQFIPNIKLDENEVKMIIGKSHMIGFLGLSNGVVNYWINEIGKTGHTCACKLRDFFNELESYNLGPNVDAKIIDIFMKELTWGFMHESLSIIDEKDDDYFSKNIMSKCSDRIKLLVARNFENYIITNQFCVLSANLKKELFNLSHNIRKKQRVN